MVDNKKTKLIFDCQIKQALTYTHSTKIQCRVKNKTKNLKNLKKALKKKQSKKWL